MGEAKSQPLIDLDGPYPRSVMWALSVLFATSSYLFLKHTAMYTHYSLGDYDTSPQVVLVSIFIIHAALAALCYCTPGGYLLDLRRRSKIERRIADGVANMLVMMEFGFWLRNEELMKESPTVALTMVFAAFLVVFLRVVAPGFGRRLPIIPSGASVYIAFQIGLVWTIMPYFAVIVVALLFLHKDDLSSIETSSGFMEKN